MSQYTLNSNTGHAQSTSAQSTSAQSRSAQSRSAQCGHDRQLGHLFLNVRQGEEVLYTSLSEPRGSLDLDTLEARLLEHGLPMPAGLKAELLRDLQGHNPRNHTGGFTVEALS